MAADIKYTVKTADEPKNTVIVDLEGEVDESNQKELEKVFKELLADAKIKNVVFNVQNLDYVNSGVIGMFAVWHEKFVSDKKIFVFAQANDHIYDIFDLVGLTSVIDYYPTVEEACLAFES